MTLAASFQDRFRGLPSGLANYCPDLTVIAAVAVAAQFLSDHYGVLAVLMALLLGIAFHFLSQEGRCVAGIDFCAKVILRIGVALLGMRISVDLLIGLGASTIRLLVSTIVATIGFGLFAAKMLGRSWRLTLITSASAAMITVAFLPKNEFSERTRATSSRTSGASCMADVSTGTNTVSVCNLSDHRTVEPNRHDNVEFLLVTPAPTPFLTKNFDTHPIPRLTKTRRYPTGGNNRVLTKCRCRFLPLGRPRLPLPALRNSFMHWRLCVMTKTWPALSRRLRSSEHAKFSALVSRLDTGSSTTTMTSFSFRLSASIDDKK